MITWADAAHQIGRRLVHLLGEELPYVAIGFMLNAYGISVGWAGVPSLVFLKHHLRDLSVSRTDDIMRRDLGITILEPADTARIGAFGVMDYHRTHVLGTLFPVAFRCRIPNGWRIVGATCNTQLRRSKHIVMLTKNLLQVDVIFREVVLLGLFGVVQKSAHRIQHRLHRINVFLLPYR